MPFVESIPNFSPESINNNYESDLLTSCGISNFSQTRIVGGTDAQPGEIKKKNTSRTLAISKLYFVGQFPWLAALGYISNSDKFKIEFYCAGSLITAQHVITTAHCISGSL